MPEIDHDYTREPVCPACGDVIGDAWEWCTDELRGHEETCSGCGAVFRAFPHYDVCYSTQLVEDEDAAPEPPYPTDVSYSTELAPKGGSVSDP